MEGVLFATFLPLASSVLSMSGSLSIALSGRRHVARQGSDPLQPGTHRREGSEVVAALRADARVHIEGDVSDRGTIPNEKLVVAQMPLHHPEGPVTLLEELLQLGPSLGRHLDVPHAPEAGPGEVEQEAVLLEEHPAQDLRPLQLLLGEVGRALGEVEEYRAGLREHRPVLELQDRDLAVWVDVLEEVRPVRLTTLGVVVDYLTPCAKQAQEQ